MSRLKEGARVRFQHFGAQREGTVVKSCSYDPFSTFVNIDGANDPMRGIVLVNNAKLMVVTQQPA